MMISRPRGPARARADRRLLTALATMAVATCWPGVILAEDDPRLERLRVAIWPEYDRPAALVMLQAWLPPELEYPVTVPLPIPVSVAAPSAVARRGPEGRLLVAEYTREERAEWSVLHVETDGPELRLEYYLDLALERPRRELTFEWPGGIDVAELSYELQQPLGATAFVAMPPPTEQLTGDDGLTYWQAELGPISRSETFTITLGYNKTVPLLSRAATQPTFPPPTRAGSALQTSDEAATPEAALERDSFGWLVVVLFVVLVGALVAWLAIRGRSSRKL